MPKGSRKATRKRAHPGRGTQPCPRCHKHYKNVVLHQRTNRRCGGPAAPPMPPTGPNIQPSTSTSTAPHSVTVEDVTDEGDDLMSQIKMTMPDVKNVHRTTHPSNAGKPQREAPTAFEARRVLLNYRHLPPWHPFASYEEYKLTRWLLKSGLSHRKVDEFLKGDVFRSAQTLYPERYCSFHDNKTFLVFLDKLHVPDLVDWKHWGITVNGDVSDPRRPGKVLTETVDLWGRDPLEAIRSLISNPAFKDHISYAPVKESSGSDEDADEIWSEMYTGDKWWRLQTEIKCDDGTVVPIILASDKTQLSTFSGDKQAWPVYLTIGNISGSIRSQPSKGATILLGYLPVTKLQCFKTQESVKRAGHRLFHYAMSLLLEPLVEAGKTGVEMPCADGWTRKIFPIVAAYLADFPEQCLITCTKSNRCPICKVDRLERGDLLDSLYRTPSETLAHLEARDADDLQDVVRPFWANLPYVNIFSCITPDILHQLHKGVFRDHLVSWAMRDYAGEIDDRFARIPPYPGLRIFARGISAVSQWTGNEYRQMEKVFLALLCGLHDEDPRFISAARAVLDFVYLAHFPVHSTSTLAMMQDALQRFHANKQVFIDLGARTHFNVPKIHSMTHYVPSVVDFGSILPLSTDGPERLHIDLAKLGYRASNRRRYVAQMILWLTRREKIAWFDSYLAYVESKYSLPLVDDPMDGAPMSPEDAVYDDELCDDEDEVEAEDLEPVDVFDRDLPKATPPVHASTVNTSQDVAIPPTDTSSGPLEDEQTVSNSDSRFPAYRISKRPAYSRVTPADLSMHFNAPHFVRELKSFLLRETPSIAPTWLASLGDLHYGVYLKFRRTLPSLRGLPAGDTKEDVVHAACASGTLPSRYSTALYVHDLEEASEYGVQGYRVARVRAIFDLPDVIDNLRPQHACRHLAYLELFTPFEDEPEKHSRLWRVSRQFSQGEARAVVVPLDLIFRSCHLVPNFGSEVDLSWSSDDVLDRAMLFYLNPFIDHHMYLFV